MRTLNFKFIGPAVLFAAGVLVGCTDVSRPVERVPVAAPGDRESRLTYDRPKPMPDDARLDDRR